MSIFTPLSEEKIAELQRQSDEVYRNRLTGWGTDDRGTEKGALDGYTNGEHDNINGLLYGTSEIIGNSEAKQLALDDITFIDSAMSKWELKDDITVYSGTNAKHYKEWVVGSERSLSAYLSTAVMEDSAYKYYKRSKTPLMIEVFVPKGTRGIYIGDNTAWPDGNEYEFLLGRGLRYKVVERTNNRLKLEVLP